MNRSHPHTPLAVGGQDNPGNAPPGQRQRALELVAQIRNATGRRHGAATTAARTLGINPGIVQKWLRDANPPPARSGPGYPLVGLLHCGACHRSMRPSRTPDGQRAYRCGTSCRPDGINAHHVEHQVGKALLCHAPNAVRHPTQPTTTEQAATFAATLLHHITIGHTGQLRLTWHPHGHPTAQPLTRRDYQHERCPRRHQLQPQLPTAGA